MQTKDVLHVCIYTVVKFCYLITCLFMYFISVRLLYSHLFYTKSYLILLTVFFVRLNLCLTDPASITSTAPTTSTKSWIGERVTLKCVTEGVPIPTITWQKPDGSETAPVTAKENTLSDVMEIDQDFGNYTCKADNGVGAAVTRIVQVNQISKWVPHGGLLFL